MPFSTPSYQQPPAQHRRADADAQRRTQERRRQLERELTAESRRRVAETNKCK